MACFRMSCLSHYEPLNNCYPSDNTTSLLKYLETFVNRSACPHVMYHLSSEFHRPEKYEQQIPQMSICRIMLDRLNHEEIHAKLPEDYRRKRKLYDRRKQWGEI